MNYEIKKYNLAEQYTPISLKIYKYGSNESSENDKNYVVPFDLAYARSIHKAQGLEYDYVKIIITPESEDIINNKIFYTAITRAKKDFKVYCMNKKQLYSMEKLLQKVKLMIVEFSINYKNKLMLVFFLNIFFN